MPTAPNSASELYEIAATGNGQDVLDAVEAMNATHGEFLTGMMMRSALNAADAEAGADWLDATAARAEELRDILGRWSTPDDDPEWNAAVATARALRGDDDAHQ